jgi:hypothetical protein
MPVCHAIGSPHTYSANLSPPCNISWPWTTAACDCRPSPACDRAMDLEFPAPMARRVRPCEARKKQVSNFSPVSLFLCMLAAQPTASEPTRGYPVSDGQRIIFGRPAGAKSCCNHNPTDTIPTKLQATSSTDVLQWLLTRGARIECSEWSAEPALGAGTGPESLGFILRSRPHAGHAGHAGHASRNLNTVTPVAILQRPHRAAEMLSFRSWVPTGVLATSRPTWSRYLVQVQDWREIRAAGLLTRGPVRAICYAHIANPSSASNRHDRAMSRSGYSLHCYLPVAYWVSSEAPQNHLLVPW